MQHNTHTHTHTYIHTYTYTIQAKLALLRDDTQSALSALNSAITTDAGVSFWLDFAVTAADALRKRYEMESVKPGAATAVCLCVCVCVCVCMCVYVYVCMYVCLCKCRSLFSYSFFLSLQKLMKEATAYLAGTITQLEAVHNERTCNTSRACGLLQLYMADIMVRMCVYVCMCTIPVSSNFFPNIFRSRVSKTSHVTMQTANPRCQTLPCCCRHASTYSRGRVLLFFFFIEHSKYSPLNFFFLFIFFFPLSFFKIPAARRSSRFGNDAVEALQSPDPHRPSLRHPDHLTGSQGNPSSSPHHCTRSVASCCSVGGESAARKWCLERRRAVCSVEDS